MRFTRLGRGVLLVCVVLTAGLAFSQSDSNGTWTQLSNVPLNPDFMLVLTDGSIAVNDYASSDWWRLVPDQTGHYLHGTWVPMGNMPVQTTGTCNDTPTATNANGCPYAAQYFASAVLMDGRLVVTGGEYTYDYAYNDYSSETTEGAVWNWQTNTWSVLTPPTGWTRVGDADSIVLPNGQYILTRNSGGTGNVAIMSPEGSPGNFGPLTWTTLAPPGKAEGSSEENWVLLPDGTIWALDISKEPESERYIPPYLSTAYPTTGQWIQAGNEPASIGVSVDKSATEDGPNVLLPNGTVLVLSGNPAASGGGVNAIYTPPTTLLGTGAWAAAPNFPASPNGGFFSECDGAASLLPNGNVFFTGNGQACYDSPGEYFEYVPGNPSLVQVISPYDPEAGTNVSSVIASYYSKFVVLPDGNILYGNDDGFETYIFAPTNNTPNPAWAPTITSYPTTVSPGIANTYIVSGTQFNGISAQNYYGDDGQNATNYPLINFTNQTTGDVQFGRTHDHSNMGVQTGSLVVSTYVDTPANLECGSATMVVIANGISSSPVPVTVDCTNSAPAFMTSPATGSTLTGPTAVFQWAASTGATAYWIDVGSSAGSNNYYQSGSLSATAQSATVSGLPVNGSTIYVTLYSLIGGQWVPNSYSYTAYNAQSAAAVLVYPLPSSTLPGGTVSFVWSEDYQAVTYALTISAIGPGGTDVYSSGYLDNSLGNDGYPVVQAVSGLPTNGETLYVTLYTVLNGQLFSNAYTYTAWNGQTGLATMATPAQSSILTGSTVTFTWNAGTGEAAYWLDVGSTPGGSQYYQSKSLKTTVLSEKVTGLPTNGSAVYATLYTELGGVYYSNTYTYTALNAATAAGVMQTPVNGSTLSGSSVTFTWLAGSGATAYWLDVGSSPGANNYSQSGNLGNVLTTTVNGLPQDGSEIYATLYSMIGGQWTPNAYTYYAYNLSGAVLATMQTPIPSSTIVGNTATFTWSAGSGTAYWLDISAIEPGGNDVYQSGNLGNALTTTVNSLPANGGMIYVTLYSLVGGQWESNAYTYTNNP